MYKISVIIPTYNCQNSLERTINSVINQSMDFKDIELILVDDYSSDQTKNIIEKFSKKYNNIKSIFLKENHGYPGYGRNIGINESTAPYVMFLDNDDEYDSEICELLYNTMINNENDLVECNFKEIKNHDEIKKQDLNNLEIEKFDSTEQIYHNNVTIWNKIFKKEILLDYNIKFITDGLNEDSHFCINYFLHCNSTINIKNYYGYYHYLHETNLSGESVDNTLNFIDSYQIILELITQNKKDVDLNRIFESRIDTTLYRVVLLKNYTFNDITQIIKKLYSFEQELPDSIHLNHPILNSINRLIIHNHITISTIILILLNKTYSLKFIHK